MLGVTVTVFLVGFAISVDIARRCESELSGSEGQERKQESSHCILYHNHTYLSHPPILRCRSKRGMRDERPCIHPARDVL